MSLQSRLSALITAVGADVKELKDRTPTSLGRVTSFVETSEPTKAIEWWTSGSLIAKIVAMNSIVSSIILNRTELRLRVKSRDGTSTAERLILDSDGLSDFVPPFVTALPTTGPNGGSLVDGQECIYLPDPTNASGNGGVAWHLKYRAAEAGSYKWYCIGGAPFSSYIGADESYVNDATWRDATTVGPSITIPLAGDYRYWSTSNQYKTGANPQIGHGIAIGTGNTPASPHIGGAQGVAAGGAINCTFQNDFLAIAAATVVKMMYRSIPSTSGNTQTRFRQLEILPVRVG